MKKILFAALAALAITSCSQNLQLKTWNPKVSYFTPIILKQLQWTK